MNKFLILLFLANLIFAQDNITTAKIKSDGKDGLHKMVLPTTIRSYSNDDLSDFRVLDSKNNEVPYYSFKNEEETATSNFQEYTIVSKFEVPKKYSSLIIDINSAKNLNEIVLYIANSDVVKIYNLSGSNNQKDWFGLSNKQELYDLNSENKTSVIKTISFPLCSYKYLKIEFDDTKTLPINVLKAGNFLNKTQKNNLLSVPFKQKNSVELKSEKKTQIHIQFEIPQIINQISIAVSDPKLFKRVAHIYKNATRKVKHKIENYKAEISSFELNSETNNTFTVSQLFEKELFIEIENQDNQPLTISEVAFYQTPVFVISDLKANENYTIKTGNKKLNLPKYDLENFKNSISTNLFEAQIVEIKHTQNSAEITKNKSFWEQSWFMWACICLGGIAILYFTSSLIKDMKNNS